MNFNIHIHLLLAYCFFFFFADCEWVSESPISQSRVIIYAEHTYRYRIRAMKYAIIAYLFATSSSLFPFWEIQKCDSWIVIALSTTNSFFVFFFFSSSSIWFNCNRRYLFESHVNWTKCASVCVWNIESFATFVFANLLQSTPNQFVHIQSIFIDGDETRHFKKNVHQIFVPRAVYRYIFR